MVRCGEGGGRSEVGRDATEEGQKSSFPHTYTEVSLQSQRVTDRQYGGLEKMGRLSVGDVRIIYVPGDGGFLITCSIRCLAGFLESVCDLDHV